MWVHPAPKTEKREQRHQSTRELCIKQCRLHQFMRVAKSKLELSRTALSCLGTQAITEAVVKPMLILLPTKIR